MENSGSADTVRADRPELSSGSDLPPGAVLRGKHQYQIENRLGRGGFGSVYRATVMRRSGATRADVPDEVAIKVFTVGANVDVDHLLRRELSSLLAIRHERIPAVYDWGLQSGVAFVVLRYLENGNLHQLRYRIGRLDERAAWRLLKDVLSAINAAHRANILHLDIKPANILLDAKGNFLLTDFGIAQGNFATQEVIQPGLGTRGYQAPEQRNRKYSLINAQTDLYGIGATVWASLTGLDLSNDHATPWVPYEEGEYGVPHLLEVRPELNAQLADVVMSMLFRDPSRRPGGAAEVLARIAEIEGVIPPSSVEHKPRFASDFPELRLTLRRLIDPLWIDLFGRAADNLEFMKFEKGELLCVQGELSHHAYVLISGNVAIEFSGRVVANETREGSFLGEVSTLTGMVRTASMRAAAPTWVCVLNAAELENLVMKNPALGIRLVKSLAERVANDRIRAQARATEPNTPSSR